ncbi:MAG TPA: hypothetical protein EYQ84_08115 [Nitrospinaceae bacterium]|jgi:Flp pilus assembly protein TadD|nr:hypothetical protein [Nitrospinaceae bacterium]
MKNIISVLAVLVFFLVSTSAFAGEGPMKLPEGAKADAKKHNKEGIASWNKKDYKGALMHFSAASKIDGSSGEIHFNEAISYDKLNKHGVAKKHFGVALKKAGANEKLKNSPILKGHLGM